MNIMQTESVSNFRNEYNKVFQQLAKGPVYLLQRSAVAAVIVSPDTWHKLIQDLEDLLDRLDIMQAQLDQGNREPEPFEPGELEAMAGHAVQA